jgi:6-pyruvoyltetrahydropterin/6-carboxytetrahydropterin synthase
VNTNNVRVTKQFTFDMAHALYGHDGPCKNIHGHTYRLHVTVLGTVMQNEKAKNGMVMDFVDMKSMVKEVILKDFDHALVLNRNAPYANLVSLQNDFERIILLPFQPTCENLLIEFKNRLCHFFNSHLQLVAIKLEETPTSYAEWRREDNLHENVS